jgi:DNA polymerase-1
MGDACDGIPGVPGIGIKTAAKLLSEFDSIERLYQPELRHRLEKAVTKKQMASLLAHEKDAFMSRDLARPIIWHEAENFLDAHDLSAPDPSKVRAACDQS